MPGQFFQRFSRPEIRERNLFSIFRQRSFRNAGRDFADFRSFLHCKAVRYDQTVNDVPTGFAGGFDDRRAIFIK
jgi:hypothetical protein